MNTYKLKFQFFSGKCRGCDRFAIVHHLEMFPFPAFCFECLGMVWALDQYKVFGETARSYQCHAVANLIEDHDAKVLYGVDYGRIQ